MKYKPGVVVISVSIDGAPKRCADCADQMSASLIYDLAGARQLAALLAEAIKKASP